MRLETAIVGQPATGLFYLSRSSGRVGCAGGGVGGEGFPERLLLLWCLLDRLGAVLARYGGASVVCHGTRVAAPWLVVFGEQFDKVGGKQSDHAPVALQATHPP